MMKEFLPLIKALTALVHLVTLYLLVTWSYAGLEFLLRSFTI